MASATGSPPLLQLLAHIRLKGSPDGAGAAAGLAGPPVYELGQLGVCPTWDPLDSPGELSKCVGGSQLVLAGPAPVVVPGRSHHWSHLSGCPWPSANPESQGLDGSFSAELRQAGSVGWLPPPSPYHPSGSSQCTSPKHPVSCIEPGLVIRFLYIIHVSMPFSQIILPSPSPTESKRLFYTSVSLLLSRIQGYRYHLSNSIYMR